MSDQRTIPAPDWSANLRRLAYVVLWLLMGAWPAASQDIIDLVSFTNSWRYESSGSDLGTAWRGMSYEDSAWQEGPGLLQYGEVSPYTAPLSTELPPVGLRVTDYFRTRFVVPAELVGNPGVQLFLTNLVDDGCVIYLNGSEIGRHRMPSSQYYKTLASSVSVEGQFDILSVDPRLLRSGENLLCAEVHQWSTNSSDVVWGARLVAHVVRPLSIIRQPQGSTNLIGDAVELSVGVAGGGASFQWRRNNDPIPGATLSRYAISVSLPQGGDYSVVASNLFNCVTSEVARVSFFPDLIGPKVLSASVRFRFGGDLIWLVFSEEVRSALEPTFRVVRTSNGATVPLRRVGTGSVGTLALEVAPSDEWVPLDDYYVVLDGVRDRRGNVIAPGTRVPVAWPVVAPVVGLATEWRYHDSAAVHTSVYAQNWAGTNFVESAQWETGVGVFHLSSDGFDSCFGWVGPDGGEPNAKLKFQVSPYLFRTKFHWPAENGPRGNLQMRLLYSDGAVVFLNGVEIYRINTQPGRVTAFTEAFYAGSPQCITNFNILNANLMAGTNWLAVAVTTAAVSTIDSNACFAMELAIEYPRRTTLPVQGIPSLELTRSPAGVPQLSWPVGGYALERNANLNDPFSYPFGTWVEVTNMANPFVLQPTSREQWGRI